MAFKAVATLELVDRLTSPLTRVKRQLTSFTRSTKQLSSGLNTLRQNSLQVGIASGIVAGAIFKGVSTAAQFSKQLSSVAAISGATSKELIILRNSALSAGASTVFTAKQAAEAQEFLALAGFNTKQIVAGLPAVLNLASAGSLDLATASDIASDTLSAFKLDITEFNRVADVLAATSANSNTNVLQLGEAFKFAAAPAAAAGMSIEETSILIGLLGNVGLKGSIAGTALRSSILKLVKPTSDASKTLQSLGVETIDTEGNFLGLTKILSQLQGGISNLGSGEKLKAIATIFGTIPVSAVASLSNALDESNKKTGEFVIAIEKSQGAAKRLAGIKLDNLVGDVNQLNSAFQDFLIKTFTPLAIALRPVIVNLTVFIRKLTEASKTPLGSVIAKIVLGTIGLLAGLGGTVVVLGILAKALPIVTGGFNVIFGVIRFGGYAVIFLGKATFFLGKALLFLSRGLFSVLRLLLLVVGLPVLIAIAIGVVIFAIWYFRDSLLALWNSLVAFLKGSAIVNAFIGFLNNALSVLLGWLANIWKAMLLVGKLILTVFTAVFSAWVGVFKKFFIFYISIWVNILKFGFSIILKLIEVFNTLGKFLFKLLVNVFNSFTQWFNKIFLSVVSVGSNIKDYFIGLWDGIIQFFAGIDLFESGRRIFSTLIKGLLSLLDAPASVVGSAFAKIRELLPFSDAREGPLSDLTLSGSKIMTTLAVGVGVGSRTLYNALANNLGLLDLNKNVNFAGLDGLDNLDKQFNDKIGLGVSKQKTNNLINNNSNKIEKRQIVNKFNITINTDEAAKSFMRGLSKFNR